METKEFVSGIAWLEEYDLILEDDKPITEIEANRMVRAITKANREVEKIEAQAKDEIDLITRRANELKEANMQKVNFLTARFTPILEEYAKQELGNGKTRSIKLLSGTVGFRKSPMKLEVLDEAQAMAWAKTHLKDAVKVTEFLLKTPILEHFKETGEMPDGCDKVDPKDNFYID